MCPGQIKKVRQREVGGVPQVTTVSRFSVSRYRSSPYMPPPVVAVNPELDDLPPLALAGLQNFFRSRNMLSWGILTRGKIDLEFDDR